MKKIKRIFAVIGVAILAGMYLITLILGLTASPATTNMLMASIACTVIVPCLLYGMMLLANVLGNRQSSSRENFERENFEENFDGDEFEEEEDSEK